MSDAQTNDSPAVIPVASNSGTLRRMNSNAPAQKVTASVIAGAIVQLFAWYVSYADGPTLPTEVTGAMTILIALAVGYLTPPGSREEIVEIRRA